MTLYEFNLLDKDSQLEIVWDEGVFLMHRILSNSVLCLYALDSFFVEIKYNRFDNQIAGCRSFRSVVALEPYLQAVKLNLLA